MTEAKKEVPEVPVLMTKEDLPKDETPKAREKRLQAAQAVIAENQEIVDEAQAKIDAAQHEVTISVLGNEQASLADCNNKFLANMKAGQATQAAMVEAATKAATKALPKAK